MQFLLFAGAAHASGRSLYLFIFSLLSLSYSLYLSPTWTYLPSVALLFLDPFAFALDVLKSVNHTRRIQCLVFFTSGRPTLAAFLFTLVSQRLPEGTQNFTVLFPLRLEAASQCCTLLSLYLGAYPVYALSKAFFS